MYKHHEESLEILKKYFSEKEETIAVILGGSVAKGNERPDSDLDAMIVISEEDYKKRLAQKRTAECVYGMCTYEGGLFDVKYMTKQYLIDAADRASEPTRNSFIGARVIYSRDEEIERVVSRIPIFQKDEKEEKLLSFYSNLVYNHEYFLKYCNPNGYMRLHAVSEIIYSVYRMILQVNEILFPCNRRLEETVAAAADKPGDIMELAKKFEESLSTEDGDRFVESFREWTPWQPPKTLEPVQTRYVADYEQWWRYGGPFVNEW